jgi:hypothetical protein
MIIRQLKAMSLSSPIEMTSSWSRNWAPAPLSRSIVAWYAGCVRMAAFTRGAATSGSRSTSRSLSNRARVCH